MSMVQKQPSFLSSYIRGETALGGWRIISRGLSGIGGLIILANLDLFNYGTYILLFALYTLLSSPLFRLLSAPVFNDIVRFISKGDEASAKKLFYEIAVIRIALTVLVALFVWVAGAALAERFYGSDVALLVRFVSLLLIANVVNVLSSMIFQARLHFTLLSLRAVLQSGLKVAFLIGILLFSTFDIVAVLTAHVVAAFLSVAALLPAAWSASLPWRRVSALSRSVLWPIVKTYGKWHMASQFVGDATAGIRPWLVKLFINTEAVAIYSVAESLFGALKLFFPTSTLSAILPRRVGDRERFNDIFLRGTKYLFVAGIGASALGAVLVPIVVMLFVPHYASSLPLFWAMLVAFPFVAAKSSAQLFLIVLRRQKFLFIVNILTVIAGIVFPLFFLGTFGLFGMALDRIAVGVLLGILYLYYMLHWEIPRSMHRTLFLFDRSDTMLLATVVRNARSHAAHLLKVTMQHIRRIVRA